MIDSNDTDVKYLTRTGICTTDFELRPAAKLFRDVAEYGYGSVQFGFSTVTDTGYIADGRLEIPDCDELIRRKPNLLRDIKNAADANGIDIIAANGTFNMCHPDREVRMEGVRRFDGFAAAAAELGCGIITLCSGTRNPRDLWTYSSENATDEAWSVTVDTIKRVSDIAERREITLAVETEASNVISSPESARKLLDTVGSKRLKMILDPANLFPAGTAKASNVRQYLRRAFDCFGSDIVLAHGKDIAESDRIDFRGTGEGIIDFVYLAQLLAESGFGGEMMLHGIYDESKFAAARKFWENARDTANK